MTELADGARLEIVWGANNFPVGSNPTLSAIFYLTIEKIMKCVVCHGNEIESMDVKEEIVIDDDIVYIPIKVPVCKTCGERYYDRRTIRFLEEIKEKT